MALGLAENVFSERFGGSQRVICKRVALVDVPYNRNEGTRSGTTDPKTRNKGWACLIRVLSDDFALLKQGCANLVVGLEL